MQSADADADADAADWLSASTWPYRCRYIDAIAVLVVCAAADRASVEVDVVTSRSKLDWDYFVVLMMPRQPAEVAGGRIAIFAAAGSDVETVACQDGDDRQKSDNAECRVRADCASRVETRIDMV